MRLSLSPTLPSNNAPSNKSSSSSSSSSPPHLTITLLPILALLTTAALAPVAAVAGAVAEGRDGANLATASDGLIRIPLVHTNQHSQAILHERHHHKKRRAHGSPDSASPASYSSKRDHAGRRRAAIDVGVEAAGVQVEIQPTNLKRPMRLKIADLARLRDIQERVSFKYAAADTATAASTNRIKRSNGSPSSASHTKRDIQARQEQQEPGSGQAQSIGDSDAAYTRTTLSKGDAAQPRPSLQAQASNVEITPYVNGREDIDFMGMVSIGNPPQEFSLIFDTGSADMWIQSKACSNCSNAPTFDPTSSSSLKNIDKPFEIHYGIGSTSGDLYTDNVSIGGKAVNAQTLAVADEMSGDWTGQVASGLMGFGMPGQSKSGGTPYFQNLVAQNKLPSNVFSFAFGSAVEGTQNASMLTLGGSEPSKYTGDFSYFPVAEPHKYWQLDLASLNIGPGASPVAGDGSGRDISKSAVIDSGTTLIAAMKNDVAAFWAGVPNATYSPCCGYYTYPCDQVVNASVSFRNANGEPVAFTISDEDLNFGRLNAFSDRCVGAVVEGDTSGLWVMGLAFLKNWYSVFDVDNMRVGFAKPTYKG